MRLRGRRHGKLPDQCHQRLSHRFSLWLPHCSPRLQHFVREQQHRGPYQQRCDPSRCQHDRSRLPHHCRPARRDYPHCLYPRGGARQQQPDHLRDVGSPCHHRERQRHQRPYAVHRPRCWRWPQRRRLPGRSYRHRCRGYRSLSQRRLLRRRWFHVALDY